jgi:hypothetical protein
VEPVDPSGLLVLCGLLQGGAVLHCTRRAVDARRRVGEPRHVAAPSRRKRRLAWTTLFALALAVAASSDVPDGPALFVLMQALLLVHLLPAAGDSVLGTRGVRSGWEARRFDELEEWLLAGDYLRWRLRGEWLACAAPAALHAELRSRLDPARESPHGRAGLDPGRISPQRPAGGGSG